MVARAGPALAALAGVRQAVLDRTITALTAYQAFRTADRALLDGLKLVDPPGADADGLTALGALDALMRSNEEASSVGAVLVAVAADPSLSRRVLTDAVTAGQQDLDRFRQLVLSEQSSLVDTVDRGKAGQRINQIVAKFSQPGAPASVADGSDALTAALSYTDLRRFAQDRVAREVTTKAQNRAGSATTTAYLVAGGAVALLLAVSGWGWRSAAPSPARCAG